MVNELGYQYLRMMEFDASLAAFRYNTEVYPQSVNVWDSLADGLEHAGKKDEALQTHRKAVSVAEASGDPNLESFRKHLDRLAGATTPGGK
jgi:Tfp pilus assembly protein PilF